MSRPNHRRDDDDYSGRSDRNRSYASDYDYERDRGYNDRPQQYQDYPPPRRGYDDRRPVYEDDNGPFQRRGNKNLSELDQLQSRGPGVATDADYEGAKEMQATQTFEGMHLKPELLKGLLQFGIIKPSSVQQRVMTPILQGHDVIAQSPSGTGKTTIFAIALLQIVDTSINSPQALAIFPTRELAQQTRVSMKAIGGYMNTKVHTCIGGKSMNDDLDQLNQGQHIITGTPGRVYDMIKRGALVTKHIPAWVIDEADEMLIAGF
eukprot:UN02567